MRVRYSTLGSEGEFCRLAFHTTSEQAHVRTQGKPAATAWPSGGLISLMPPSQPASSRQTRDQAPVIAPPPLRKIISLSSVSSSSSSSSSLSSCSSNSSPPLLVPAVAAGEPTRAVLSSISPGPAATARASTATPSEAVLLAAEARRRCARASRCSAFARCATASRHLTRAPRERQERAQQYAEDTNKHNARIEVSDHPLGQPSARRPPARLVRNGWQRRWWRRSAQARRGERVRDGELVGVFARRSRGRLGTELSAHGEGSLRSARVRESLSRGNNPLTRFANRGRRSGDLERARLGDGLVTPIRCADFGAFRRHEVAHHLCFARHARRDRSDSPSRARETRKSTYLRSPTNNATQHRPSPRGKQIPGERARESRRQQSGAVV